jgi:hypothetical protein
MFFVWDSFILLSNGGGGLLPLGLSGRSVKLTTQLHFMPKFKKCVELHFKSQVKAQEQPLIRIPLNNSENLFRLSFML